MDYRKCEERHSLTKRNFKLFLEFLSDRDYLVTAIDDYGLLYKIEKEHFLKFICDTNFNSSECSKLLKDKLLTYLVLKQLGISIPEGTYLLLGAHQYSDSPEAIVQSFREVRYPVVVKPNDSSLGKGITVLRKFSPESVVNAVRKVQRYSDVLLVQEYLSGQEYRVVAIRGEMVFALKKYKSPRPPAEAQMSECTKFSDIVLRSMQCLGATVCGYDFIVTDGGVKVLEINSNPFIFRIKDYLAKSTRERYFLGLESLLRRDYGY